VGIDAPRDVAVHREEIYRELQLANTNAASPSTDAVTAFTQRASGQPRRKKREEPSPQHEG
jgi:carbon storage regulator